MRNQQQNKQAKHAKQQNIRRQPKRDSKSKRVNYDNTREEEFIKHESKGVSNDVAWYARNEEMLKSAASIAFSSYSGQYYPVANSVSIPGVMAIYYDIAIGGDLQEPALQQAKEGIYSFVVHANSRNTSYDPTDLMVLVMSSNEVFRAIAHAIRAYGTMRTYMQENYYFPNTVIRAMGFDPQDLRTNLANMWFDINNLIAQSAQLWAPNDLPFIKRQFWMNSFLYADGESTKAQVYLYVPQYFYYYQSNYADNGSGLEPVPASTWNPITGNTCTWSTYVSMVQQMLDRLLSDQDRGLIYGDILKAYTADKIYALSEISSDYTVIPVYDKEVLTQIHNSMSFFNGGGGIFQTQSGKLLKNFDVKHSNLGAAQRTMQYAVFDFFQKENPTPEQCMVASRMTAISGVMSAAEFPGNDNTYVSYQPASCGTEFPIGYGIWYLKNMRPNLSLLRSVLTTQPTADQMMLYSTFDWAPLLYVLQSGATPPVQNDVTAEPLAIIGDVENWIPLGITAFNKMNTTALFSEYGVPTL